MDYTSGHKKLFLFHLPYCIYTFEYMIKLNFKFLTLKDIFNKIELFEGAARNMFLSSFNICSVETTFNILK